MAAAVSFPGHKLLVNNLVDFISIFPAPLLLSKLCVKDQKNKRQMCENNTNVQLTQKSVMKGDIRLSRVVKSQKHISETITIVNFSTVKYSKRSEPRNKEGNESNPDEIITEQIIVDVDVDGHEMVNGILQELNYADVQDEQMPSCSYKKIECEEITSSGIQEDIQGIPMSEIIEEEESLNEHGRYDRNKKRKGKGNAKSSKKPRTG